MHFAGGVAVKNRKFVSKYIIFSVPFIVAFLVSQAVAADKVKIGLISGPFGTGSYVLGTALEEIVREQSDQMIVSHTESPGVGFNLKKMAKKPELKNNTIIANADSVIAMGRNKSGLFKRLKEPIAKDIRAIAIYNAAIRFYVSRDPSIKEITDLKGKTVGLGTKQQAWGFAALWDFNLGANMTDSDFNPQLIGTKAAITAFKDHIVDAVVGAAYVNPSTRQFVPAPFFRELTATGDKLYYINTGQKVLDNFALKLKIRVLPYTLLPESTPGLNQPITVPLGTVGWYAYLPFPEEQAYHLTKLIISNVEKFAGYHGLGKLMTKELLCFGLTPEETHPGAYRAYKEAGLMK